MYRPLLIICMLLSSVAAFAQNTFNVRASREVPPVPAVAVDEPTEADLLAVARLRDPAIAFERMQVWLPVLNPSFTSESMHQQLLALGLDREHLREHASIYLCLWTPPNLASPPGWTLRVPATEDSPLWPMTALMGKAVTNLDGDLILADSEETLEARVTNGGKLKGYGAVKGASDFQIYLNTVAFVKAYGAKAWAQIAAIRAMGESAGMGNQTRRLRRRQRLLGLPLESLLSLLEQTRSATFAMNLEPDAAEMSFTIVPLPNTVLNGVLDRKPVDMPDLSKYAGDSHTLTAQIAVSEIRDLIDLVDSLKKPPDSNEETRPTEKIEAMLDLLDEAKPREYAFAMDVTPAERFAGTILIHADDPEMLVDKARRSDEFMRNSTVGDLLGSNRLDVTMTTAARQFQGAPVDHADLNFREPASLNPFQSKLFNAMWGKGETTLEMAPLGDLALFAVGKPIEDAVSEGAGKSMQARRYFSPGAFCYLDFDLAAYTQMTMAFAGGKSAGVTAPPFSAAFYHQNGAGSYRMKFPIELAAAMRKIGQASGMGRRGRRQGASAATTQTMTQPADSKAVAK